MNPRDKALKIVGKWVNAAGYAQSMGDLDPAKRDALLTQTARWAGEPDWADRVEAACRALGVDPGRHRHHGFS